MLYVLMYEKKKPFIVQTNLKMNSFSKKKKEKKNLKMNVSLIKNIKYYIFPSYQYFQFDSTLISLWHYNYLLCIQH